MRRPHAPTTSSPSFTAPYWSLDAPELARQLGVGLDGLTPDDAAARLRRFGPNQLRERHRLSRLGVLLSQLRNPLLLILVFAASASALTGEWVDSGIVLVIVLASIGIGYSREYSAQSAAAALEARVRARTTVLREGQETSVSVDDVVPGDVVLLSAGSLVPADGVVIDHADFFVSEAVLTGESFPVDKRPGVVRAEASLRERSNCVFFGTNVRSGTARVLVTSTGSATEFGAIAHRLTLRPPETEFDRGIRHFGYLLTSVMLVMVLIVFAVHMVRGRPPVETLLFSIALAVGLSPELLPAILSINLARGAQLMATHGVLVRRLNAIENLGSMDVLCTDKTGTLTEGVVELEGAYAPCGTPSADVASLAAQNAALQTGLTNPLDEAIVRAHPAELSGVRKLAEIPFDANRKRASVVVQVERGVQIVVKGAFHHILEICTASADGRAWTDEARAELERRYEDWGRQGIRVVAVAFATLAPKASYGRGDERDLTFAGFLTFLDRPKAGVSRALADLTDLGVSVKVITGDSRLVAEHVASLVRMPVRHVLTGDDLAALNDEALWQVAERTDLFVEVDPNQKERIILALKKMGHVVGFLGDGVNDAPAMHAADTSLSVERAVDVARQAADFVLLDSDLDVIRRGIEEGRRTFANTLKYILTTMSANLGNMTSMALASLMLPFLPLLAGQILLNNFLSDVPAVGLADDAVDEELVARPGRWSTRFIAAFMIEFGLLSSLFDFLTFATLLGPFWISQEIFRTGWFVESLLTELAVALVVRTRRPFFRSRPGRVLLWSTVALAATTLAIPYLPFVRVLGFAALPVGHLAALCGITTAYVAATELLKRRFYRTPAV
ncbi:MAG: magnesium-translocating P-type ATPase [Vicinamibacterales bacterium]